MMALNDVIFLWFRVGLNRKKFLSADKTFCISVIKWVVNFEKKRKKNILQNIDSVSSNYAVSRHWKPVELLFYSKAFEFPARSLQHLLGIYLHKVKCSRNSNAYLSLFVGLGIAFFKFFFHFYPAKLLVRTEDF